MAIARAMLPMIPAAIFREPALGFVEVPVGALRVGAEVDFALFTVSEGGRPPRHYQRGGLALTASARAWLEEYGNGNVYARAAEHGAVNRYLERHLAAILDDRGIAAESRAGVLYHTARTFMEEVLADPFGCRLAARSERIAEAAAAFIGAGGEVFRHVIRSLSFDGDAATHGVNVFLLSVSLGAFAGMGVEDEVALGRGALLHDLGKLRVDPALLEARGDLSDEERRNLEMHAAYGEEMLRELGVTDDRVLDVVRHHHEKRSGNGYPDGLPAKQITAFTRICTICDVFEALSARRIPEAAARSFPALQAMRSQMSEDLDPEYFYAFVRMMAANGG